MLTAAFRHRDRHKLCPGLEIFKVIRERIRCIRIRKLKKRKCFIICSTVMAPVALFLAYSLLTSKEFRFNPSAVKGYHLCAVQEKSVHHEHCRHTFDPPLPNSSTIVITFINKEWVTLGKNWICSAENVGLHNALYLIAMEPGVCQMFPTTPCYQHPTAAISGTHFGQPAYQQLMIERTKIIRSMLPCTKSRILLADTDVVFTKNPMGFLDAELSDHDILFQEDSTGVYLVDQVAVHIFSYICGGFVYLKPSNKICDFYDSVLRYQTNWNWNDQAGLNICIRHHSHKLRWKTLDKTLFPNGKEFFFFYRDNTKALAVHANFMPKTVDKVAAMINQGVWCLKELGSQFCKEYWRDYCQKNSISRPLWCKNFSMSCLIVYGIELHVS